MSSASRQVLLLSGGQALLLTNAVTLVAVNGLAGYALAADKTLATLPVTTYVIGAALATLPASLLMQRIGRRAGFSIGALFGIAGALIAALAVSIGSFALLCAGTLVSGFYNAFGQYFRFAAADVADHYDPGFKERAISLVLAGGIVGGIIGPETSKISKDLLPAMFAGSYAVLALFALLSLLLAQGLRIPVAVADAADGPARPIAQIMRQPVFIVAVVAATMGYGVMNLLMTATPLSMQSCGYPYADAALILEWHVIGMYGPGFFTGSLIRRFGAARVMLAGCLLYFLCISVALSGVGIGQFWFALFTLGVGWNFLYTGGTTLLTRTYTVAEKAKVQGVNDLLVFVTMVTSSFSSGALFSASGWNMLNWLSLPFIALVVVAVSWLRASETRAHRVAQVQ